MDNVIHINSNYSDSSILSNEINKSFKEKARPILPPSTLRIWIEVANIIDKIQTGFFSF